MEEFNHDLVDYFGSQIEIGDHGVRVDVGSPHRPFKKITVVKFDHTRRYDFIGIHAERRYGNRKPRTTWVSSHQIITQGSLRPPLRHPLQTENANQKISSIEDMI